MSNATFGFLISAILTASPALAQPSPETATAASLAAAAAAHPATQEPSAGTLPGKASAAAGTTVGGITVEAAKPMSMKSCSSRDRACVATVVAQLKELYPQQLQKWCREVERRAVVTNLNINDVNSTAGSPAAHPQSGQFAPPAVAKVACASDRK